MRQTERTTRRIGVILLAIFMYFIIFANGAGAIRTHAATESNFERSDVMDDLRSVRGFSLQNYPSQETEKPTVKLVDFEEYCYDFRASKRGNYGLYLYLYNPSGQRIATQSVLNRVRIAVAYDSDPVTDESVATDWEDFGLKFCSVGTGNGNSRLFYKFKVIDHRSTDGKTIAERVNSTERRYDVSGFELLTEGERNTTAYPASVTYLFRGYAEGYGTDGQGVSFSRKTWASLEFDLHHTAYRFPYINQNGPGHQNQLDSVYFAIPKEINKKYGDLYRVKCRWDEQKTTPVIVTNNSDVSTQIAKNLGQKNGVTDVLGIFENFSGSPDIPVLGWLTSPPTCVADWGWGYQHRNFYDEGHGDDETNGWIGSIGGVLVKDDTAPGYVFKSDKSNVKETYITATQMADWIYNHDKAAYLFSDGVDEGRTKGYQEHTFTAGEPFDMLTFNQTASGWDKFCLNWQTFWGGKKWDFGPEQQDPVEPIRLVGDGDFTGTDAADAGRLYVHEEDFDEFESFYDANKSMNNVFLLRFAVTDYYSNMQTVLTSATWSDPSTWNTGTKDNTSTYMARETVFLDFTVIELTFADDTTETTIPAVASPIDAIGGIDGPAYEDVGNDLFAWLIGTVAVLAVLLAGAIYIDLRLAKR